jgi:hypothetical protein
MTGLEDIVQAVMSAPPERREEALRLLQGNLPRPEPYLTLRELGRRLGFSTATLRRWQVPGHDLGASPRYRFSEVEAYLKTDAFKRRLMALRAIRRAQRNGKPPQILSAPVLPGLAGADVFTGRTPKRKESNGSTATAR